MRDISHCNLAQKVEQLWYFVESTLMAEMESKFNSVVAWLVSLIDCYVVQLSQVFMLRVFPVGTNC